MIFDYLACASWFNVTLPIYEHYLCHVRRSSSSVKVHDHAQEENVAEVVGATSSEGFLVYLCSWIYRSPSFSSLGLMVGNVVILTSLSI